MKRAFFLLILGGILGVALGLYVGWVLYPAELVNVTPAELTPALQADYLRLVAATYAQDDDFTAVQTRLAALNRDDLNDWIRRETVDMILAGGEEQATEIRQMVRLATHLGLDSPAFVPYLPDVDPPPQQEPSN